MSDSEDDHPPSDIFVPNDKKKVHFDPVSSTYNPTESTLNTNEEDLEDDKREPLLAEDKEKGDSPVSVVTKRKIVDLPFAIVFLICFFLMLILGISFHFSNKPRMVPIEGTMQDYLFKTISHSIVPITILGVFSAFFGFIWSYFLRKVVKTTVWVTVYSIPFILFVCSIWCFSSAFDEPATQLSALVMSFVFMFFCVTSVYFVKKYMKQKITITIKLMEIACEVLIDHPIIFGISAVVTVFYIGTSSLWLWNFSRTFMLGFVKEVEGSEPVWVFNPESYFLMGFFVFVFLWTSSIISNIQTYILSEITCVWYFHRNDFVKMRHGVVNRAVVQSVTSSFGSICLGSLVVPTSNILQISAAVISRQKIWDKYPKAKATVNYISDLIFRLTSIVNKYSLVYCSLKGSSFFESTKTVTAMLTRNNFERVTIDVFARFTLWLWCCSLSCLFALFINTYGIKSLESVYSWATASLGFSVCYFVLSFFSEIILKVVDALFVCYFVEIDTYPTNQPSQENLPVHTTFKRVISPSDQTIFSEEENSS